MKPKKRKKASRTKLVKLDVTLGPATEQRLLQLLREMELPDTPENRSLILTAAILHLRSLGEEELAQSLKKYREYPSKN